MSNKTIGGVIDKPASVVKDFALMFTSDHIDNAVQAIKDEDLIRLDQELRWAWLRCRQSGKDEALAQVKEDLDMYRLIYMEVMREGKLGFIDSLLNIKERFLKVIEL